MAQAPIVHVEEILAGDHTGETVTVRGWVHRQRSTGGIAFVVVRDGTGVLQCTIKADNVPEEAFEASTQTRMEASVIVTGEIAQDDRAPGGYELKATDFTEVGPSPDVPLYEDMGIEHELDHRHLWLRSQKLTAVAKVRATAVAAMEDWFETNGFTQVWPSILTQSAAEGGATVFEVEYFGEPAYLTQSSQMYLEALCFSLERVWCLAPSFRAEKSRTPKHLTEYWHLEAEQAWCDHEQNLEIQEGLVAAACQAVAEQCTDELEILERDPERLARIQAPFERIHYDEAIELLADQGHEISWGDDFGAPHERALSEHFDGFIFVTHFPAKIKAFYMALDDDGVHAKCGDLIAPEGYGELIGGSERSTDLALIEKRLAEDDANLDDYQWFLDLRRYGSVPHSGFGLGLERFVMFLCGLDHIRDAVPFPRTPNRIRP